MNKLIAHRGDINGNEENTLVAFEKTIKNNDYLGFECDVRQTKDGYFIIYHDPLYQGNLVKNTLYNQMKRIITLQDVLKLQTNKIIMIDIKDPFLDIESFYQIINKHQDLNIYIISFYNNIIKKLNKSERKYKIGILNYVLNTSKEQFKYDFLCILGRTINFKIINIFKNMHKELFVYNIKKEDIKYEYPYYIIDSVNKKGS